MNIVDAKGLLCPVPLIETKKMLNSISEGDKIKIILDNKIANDNVNRYLNDLGCKTALRSEGELFYIETEKPTTVDNRDPKEYCQTSPDSYSICFKNNRMGDGDDDLGDLLIQALINTIKDADKLPDYLIFYNNGVKLTTDDSPLFDALAELEDMGVELVICGTCTNYYEISDKISLGIISNMYRILELLSSNHIVYP